MKIMDSLDHRVLTYPYGWDGPMVKRDEPLGYRYTDGWIDGRAGTGSRDSGDDLRKRSSFHISLLSSKVVVTHQATLSSTLSLSVEVHSVYQTPTLFETCSSTRG
jgi:hypothetical protein